MSRGQAYKPSDRQTFGYYNIEDIELMHNNVIEFFIAIILELIIFY
jgi:hypothetical protein